MVTLNKQTFVPNLPPTCPSCKWPWLAATPHPRLYLCSPSCCRSQLPGSACTASLGSPQTSPETEAPRCSGPGPRRSSSRPRPGLAAGGCRHTAQPVKAQHRYGESSPRWWPWKAALCLCLASASFYCDLTYCLLSLQS